MRPAVLVLALLAGCVPVPPDLPPPGFPPDDACGAPDLQGLVGQPAAVLATMRFGGPVRILRPGDPMTEDYSPQRLNIEIDAGETIASLWCG